MHHLIRTLALAVTVSLLLAGAAFAQLATKQVLTLAEAKKIAAAARAEAEKNSWNVVIAIVDDAGELVYLERMDDVQTGSVLVAQAKARTAALFRRPSRAFEEGIAKGRTAVLGLHPDLTPIIGGWPLKSGSSALGAIGVSGVRSEQDEQVAKAGAALVN